MKRICGRIAQALPIPITLRKQFTIRVQTKKFPVDIGISLRENSTDILQAPVTDRVECWSQKTIVYNILIFVR